MSETLSNLYKETEKVFNKFIAAMVKDIGFKTWKHDNKEEFELLTASADMLDHSFEYMGKQEEKLDEILRLLESINRKLENL